MNSILENIFARRSVRRFEDRAIPRDFLELILAAGQAAPSGSNAQAWRFVVVQDPGARARLAALSLPVYHQWLATMPPEFREMRRKVDEKSVDPVYYSAPAIVFVIGKGSGAGVFDCPMVCENMMLAARSLEIGSCWVFIGSLAAADPEVKALLGLQENERIYGPILFGYPQGGFPASPEKRPPQVEWK